MNKTAFYFVAAVLAAGALRLAAARGELWFDEVWTLRLLQEFVEKPADLVFRLKHDNNHFLNSLVVYAVGPEGEAWMYRWPAVLAGTATVALAGWVQRRRGPATVLAAIVLCGCSYVLVHYSSEARGYAYQMFLLLAAYAALREAEETGHAGWEWLFAVSAVLGLLAQPLFLVMFVAAQLWTWLPPPRDAVGRILLKAFCRTIVPGVFFAWLYWVNLRGVIVGGGEKDPLVGTLVRTLSLVAGGPTGGWGVYLGVSITIVVTAAAAWRARTEPRRAALYAYLILVAPAIVLAASQRADVYPRYFLTSTLFLYLLWSDWLGELHGRLADGRLWYRVLVTLFVLANGWHVARLVVLERSHYEEALALLKQRTPGDRIVLFYDHPLRHRIMLDYYGPRVTPQKPIDAGLPAPETAAAAEWIMTHDTAMDAKPSPAIRLESGQEFRLVQYYPFAGLSGWSLGLYRRTDEAPPTPAGPLDN